MRSNAAADLLLAREADLDASHVALVGHVRGADLEDHGVADVLRGFHRSIDRQRRQRLCERDLIGVEQSLRRGLGQDAGPFSEHRAHEVLGALTVESETDRDAARCFVQGLEVLTVGHEVHEGADRLLWVGIGSHTAGAQALAALAH